MSTEKKLQHRALDHSDNVATVIAALVGLAGILHLPDRFGITSDELAMALGFSFTILAFVRGRLEKAYRMWLQGGRFTGPKPEEPKGPANEPPSRPSESPLPKETEEDDSVVPPPPKIGS